MVRDWIPYGRRLGLYAAVAQSTIGLAYIATGVAGQIAQPPGSPPLSQSDPWLAALEALIVCSAAAMTMIMSALHACSPLEERARATAALAFTICFAVLTSATHFVSLTAGRQLHRSEQSPPGSQLVIGPWPSIALAIDLLAWDVFLGLALLAAAGVFRGGGLRKALRWTMRLSAALCLAGSSGPITGRMSLQYLGIAGYAFVLLPVTVLLALHFAQLEATNQA